MDCWQVAANRAKRFKLQKDISSECITCFDYLLYLMKEMANKKMMLFLAAGL